MAKIRVILADDHGVVRDGLKMLINAQPDLEVVGEAVDGEQPVELIGRLQPDVAILDIGMPILNGLEVIARLKEMETSDQGSRELTANEDRGLHAAIAEDGCRGLSADGVRRR